MALENELAEMNTHLKRIADSLENLLAEQGFVLEAPGAPADDKPAEEKPAAKKKTTKKAPAKKKKKKAANEQVVGKTKPSDDDGEPLTIKDHVRPALLRLKEAVSGAAVKSLLKRHGASSVQQLDEKSYSLVIEAVNKELGDDDD